MKKRLLFFLALFFCASFLMLNAQTPEFYGMTSTGGGDNIGNIFKTDINGDNAQLVFDFPKENSGRNPVYSELTAASDGKLYGMTANGGTNSRGVLFAYDPGSNTYTKKLDFNGTNGANPNGSLMEASNGKLYGMTVNGGANNRGVLFEYDTGNNAYTKKLGFNGNNGVNPLGSIMEASNGKLYGMTLFLRIIPLILQTHYHTKL